MYSLPWSRQHEFFGINVYQRYERSIETNLDDKMVSLYEYSLAVTKRKQFEFALNIMRINSYMSAKSSMFWTGIVVSLFCSFISSYLQQKSPNLCAYHLVERNNLIRKLKTCVTAIYYPIPELHQDHNLNLFIFADASGENENGHVEMKMVSSAWNYIAGLLIGDLKKCSVFNTSSFYHTSLNSQ